MDILSFLSDPEVERHWQLLLLIVARILPIVTFTPLFGGPETPGQFRFGFSMLVGFVLLFPLAATSYPAPVSPSFLIALITKEAFLGGVLALMIRMIFDLLSSTGAVIDVARGATIANVLDPVSREQRSVIASFLNLTLVTLFLTVGGQRVLFLALGDGFVRYPPGVLLPDGMERGAVLGTEAALRLLTLLTELFAIAVQLSMPIVAVIFVVDAALGLVNKVAPKIQVFFLGMTLKGTLGILILLLIFALLARALLEETTRFVLRVVAPF